jgi:hypothetical protein
VLQNIVFGWGSILLTGSVEIGCCRAQSARGTVRQDVGVLQAVFVVINYFLDVKKRNHEPCWPFDGCLGSGAAGSDSYCSERRATARREELKCVVAALLCT